MCRQTLEIQLKFFLKVRQSAEAVSKCFSSSLSMRDTIRKNLSEAEVNNGPRRKHDEIQALSDRPWREPRSRFSLIKRNLPEKERKQQETSRVSEASTHRGDIRLMVLLSNTQTNPVRVHLATKRVNGQNTGRATGPSNR